MPKTEQANKTQGNCQADHADWGQGVLEITRSELESSYRYQGNDPDDPGDEIPAQRRVFHYDNIGNRKDFTAAAGSPLYYCANKLNQYDYTDETTSCPPSQPTDSFDYDDDGNLIDDGTFEYSWDAENRLISIVPSSPSTDDKKVEFAYDYMGRRVRKTAWTYNSSSQWVEDTDGDRLFVYDGWNS